MADNFNKMLQNLFFHGPISQRLCSDSWFTMLRLLLKGISVLVNRGGPGFYNPWSPVQGAVSFTCLLVHGSILLVTISLAPSPPRSGHSQDMSGPSRQGGGEFLEPFLFSEVGGRGAGQVICPLRTVLLRFLRQVSFSNIVFMLFIIFAIQVVSFVHKTLEKPLLSWQNVWICYCTENSIVMSRFYTWHICGKWRLSYRGGGIVSFCVPSGGE